MCQSDKQCVAQCLDGHPEAFRKLVERYQRPIMAHLTSRLHGADAAAEVAQESFVRAYFGLGKLKDADSFFSWLLGISQRVMLENFRQRRAVQSLSATPELAAPSNRRTTQSDIPLSEALDSLPAIYREVTLLRYFAGLSCEEISRRLDVPLGTVTKRLSRAYSLLRQLLASHSDDDHSKKVRS
jgi:RNA polymerase sigma-70 factor, ECF subfamily